MNFHCKDTRSDPVAFEQTGSSALPRLALRLQARKMCVMRRSQPDTPQQFKQEDTRTVPARAKPNQSSADVRPTGDASTSRRGWSGSEATQEEVSSELIGECAAQEWVASTSLGRKTCSCTGGHRELSQTDWSDSAYGLRCTCGSRKRRIPKGVSNS